MCGLSQRRTIVSGHCTIQKGSPLRNQPSLAPSLQCEQGMRACQAAVRGGAGPIPKFRRPHHAGAHGIQFNIAQSLPQMRFIERTRVKPSLPDVAGRRLPRVPVGRVASMGLFERLRKRSRAIRNHDQVHMIRHQTIAQHRELVAESGNRAPLVPSWCSNASQHMIVL